MATKTKKPKHTRSPRQPRPKQQHLPGMEPPSVPELDAMAEAYREIRNQRQSLTKREVEKHDILLAEMKKRGFTTYEYDGQVVNLVAAEKVRVRAAKAEDPDGYQEDDDGDDE